MFKKPETGIIPKDIDTLIGPDTKFKGDIESRASIRIDGFVEGNLSAQGDVLIGSSGEIKGNIEAENVFISGVVEGNVNASGMLKLFSTSRLCGDISVNTFVSDEGGVFHGHCNMIYSAETESEAKPVKPNIKKTSFKKKFIKSTLLSDTGEDRSISTGE